MRRSLGVFNEGNLFARGYDFRLGSFATDAFGPSADQFPLYPQ
jgi:hypothetical protein